VDRRSRAGRGPHPRGGRGRRRPHPRRRRALPAGRLARWPADTRSRNHHFFGTIGQWLYEDLAGFRPLEAGYRRIEFRPEIPAAGLDFVAASYESVRGAVETAWRRTSEGLELDVTVPPNAEGRVLVPAPGPESVTETLGGAAVAAGRAPSVTFVGVEGGRVVYDVGSGRYRFRVESGRPD